jgi:hypothetical protein
MAAVQNKERVDQLEAVNRPQQSYWSKLIPRTLGEIFLALLVLLVISVHLKYLLNVRTTVPHGDEWSLLDGMFRSLDEHFVGAWLFRPRNGHFLIPGTLAYLVSWRCFSLDLMPLRLLNFPICVGAFLLIAHVINAQIKAGFRRFYLYLGACFIVFNLCLWEFFTMGYLFTAMLSALFGGIGLYYMAKATQFSEKRRNNLLVGLVFLIASVLSLGAGYAATAAAILLLALVGLRRLSVSRPIPKYRILVYAMACTLGLLTIVSHPLFHLKSRITGTVYHLTLVAGSAGSSFLDQNGLLAQNVAFVCGVLLVITSLSIGINFLIGHIPLGRLLPTFSFSLVLFGLFGCLAVAVSRGNLSGGEFLSSRYTLYSAICLLGVMLHFAWGRVFWLTHVWCFAAAAYTLTTVREHRVAFFRPAVYQKIEVAVRNMDALSDEQVRATLYWRENTKGVRRVVARMRRDRLNIFRAGDERNAPP